MCFMECVIERFVHLCYCVFFNCINSSFFTCVKTSFFPSVNTSFNYIQILVKIRTFYTFFCEKIHFHPSFFLHNCLLGI